MNFNTALHRIALAANVDASELIAFANEDTVGGFGQDVRNGGVVVAENDWPVGSLWAVEGRVLYALVRALRPAVCVEIGTSRGCSATHILSALYANGKGKLISIDVDANAGNLIPDALRGRWSLIAGDALTNIPKGKIDFVFEDASHFADFTRDVLNLVKTHKPRAILSHDAEHFLVGTDVRNGFRQAMGRVDSVLIEPSDCGLAYWFEATQ